MAKAKGNKRYFIVGSLAFLLFLVAMLPLNVVYQQLNPNLPIRVQSVSGTLWSGSIVASHPMVSQFTVNWEMSPASLFSLSLSPEVEIQSDLVQLAFQADINPVTMNVSVTEGKGYLSSSVLNQALKAQRVKLSGDLELSNLNLTANLNERLASEATGQLVWMGGTVNYPKGRKVQTTTLPMLVAKISDQSGSVLIDVATVEGASVASANVKTDGWAGIAVKKRMIDLVGEPWPSKADADSVVFEMSEKVF